MKKTETIDVVIFYCDYCKKKITDGSYSSVRYKDDRKEEHFHSVYTPGTEKTCLDRRNEEWLKEHKENNN